MVILAKNSSGFSYKSSSIMVTLKQTCSIPGAKVSMTTLTSKSLPPGKKNREKHCWMIKAYYNKIENRSIWGHLEQSCHKHSINVI